MFDANFVETDSLLIGRVRGVLDGAAARKLVEFVELTEAEREQGFNRFCDLTQLEGINLSTDEIASLAARRRGYRPKTRVKSAFLVGSPLTLGTVYIFKALLQSERIEVRWFDSVEAAAAWLEVRPSVLCPKNFEGGET
jgi:hypothetical protein